ncbi:MAG: PilZ domain-containing protein [Lentisphaerae bacterium]|nr:PilZ domain-containing protein [Lentisphaerota bacterium]
MRNERRKQPRVQEKNQVAVTVLEADGAPDLVDKTFFCPTEDISATGLRLCLHQRVPVGALLSMRIAFHKPVRAFKHEGRVVWFRTGDFNGHPHALGVQFTQLQEGSIEIWNSMLASKIISRGAMSEATWLAEKSTHPA